MLKYVYRPEGALAQRSWLKMQECVELRASFHLESEGDTSPVILEVSGLRRCGLGCKARDHHSCSP